MRTSAWVTILGLAGLAVACGDQATEPLPDRDIKGLRDGGTIALATASSGDGYSITTDKDDYQPGDVVHLTGAGWEPEDVLDIVLHDEPQTHPPLQWSVTVGSDGTFADDTYTVDEGDLNVTFTLLATSRSTGQSLSMTFTDGNLQGVTLTPANVFVQPTGTASTSIDVTIGGTGTDCTVTLSLLPTPALPAGASASITPNPVQTGSINFSRTLTFTTASVTPGSYPFTVHAVRGANCQGNGNVDVTGNLIVFGAPTKLVYGQQPSNTPGGGTITPPVIVRVLDATNNLVANSNASVQIAIQNNPGAGTLTGSLTLAAVGGIATFSDLSIDKIGTGYTLRATSGALTGVTSSTFTITLGAAAKLGFTLQPTGANINANLGTQPRVAVLDAGGNIRTTGTGSGATITLAVTPGTGTGTLSCTTNPLGATNGLASFAGCKINAAGTGYTLRATSPGLTSIDSDPFNILNPDNSAPSVTCTVPDLTIWYATDVQVPCIASDPSGLANAADASFTLSTNVPAGTESTHALTTTRTVCDALDNCTPVGFTFKVDKKSPVVSCGGADGLWHSDNVSIACTATDGGSGLASSGDASFSLLTAVANNAEDPNASTSPRSVADAVGNMATAGPVSGNKVDKKKPVVTCGTADGSWHADNVSIHCTATDGGSGIESGDASFNLTTSVADGSETANAATDSRDVADKVGNSETSGPIGGNQVDRKAPQFTCEAAPSDWSASDVTRDCVAVDGGSGLAPPTDASFSLHTSVATNTETATAQTNSKQLADVVGNKSTAGPLGNNKVDKKDPEVACGGADGDWHANDVAIACTGSDGGAGLAEAGDASFNLHTSVAANTETANASTNSRSVADLVGHTVTAGPVAGNKVDKKAPVVTCGPADGLWHANNVAIGCTAADDGSGLKVAGDASFNLVTTVGINYEISNASTNSKAVLDGVGNSGTAGPVAGNKIDRKAPQVACGSADGLWHANDVSIGCTASDGGSGLAFPTDANFNLATNLATGNEDADVSTGSRDVADGVGNKATAGPVPGNQIDKKGPTLSLTCPNAPIVLNQPISATWNASDGGSGVANGFTTGSFSVPSNTVGPHTATAVAGLSHDNVGNTSTASPPCGYGVNYGFAGFFTPVDPDPTMNGANSGQAIPLKWTLKDFNGAPVTSLTSVNVTAASLTCGQGTTTDLVEEYAAGTSGLINKGDGSYQFNWKTPTSYAKSCKTLKLDLGDGSPVKVALFEFKK